MSPISSNDLEKQLWGAANLLRGLIDPGDYKKYIFPLLFYKRICDVYDEECKTVLEDTDGDTDEAKKRFYHQLDIEIPEGAHWNDVRAMTKDVGLTLQKALRDMETHNSDTLSGIFGDAQWTNKEKFSDAIMRDLIEHFSAINLSLENVPQDQLGEAYEYLIKKFADDSGHTAAEFYTNRTLVRLMTLIMDPKPGESIYDPTCGSGGMLLVSALQVKEQGGEHRSIKLYGQEINLLTSAIAKMNLYLHGIEDFRIVRGDTLAQPAFTNGDGSLKTFDVILANPPYSIKNWNRTAFINDPYGRNIYGVPPQGRADYAFFQHIIKSMDLRTGRCAILFPHGVLFREEEYALRKKIVDADLIDCVLGLGPNLFYNSTMEACVVFCKMNKPKHKKGRILFINAINEVALQKSQGFLENNHIQKIFNAYQSYCDIKSFSKVADLNSINRENFDLRVGVYVPIYKEVEVSEEKTLSKIINDWQESSMVLRKYVQNLYDALEEVGLRE
jgi:type I restriction enzyme M protein